MKTKHLKVRLPHYYLIFQGYNDMYDQIIENFRASLDTIDEHGSWLEKAEKGIKISNKTISKLKKLIEKEDFESVTEEIYFFKHIKPIPMSYLIFYSEVRSCEHLKPKAGNSFQVRFLEKELKKVNKFFQKNNDFVIYMEQGHNYIDHQLFTRDHSSNYPFTPIPNYYQYPEFSSSHGMLWAKVQAMYKYIHYIRESIQSLQPGNKSLFSDKKHELLKWSGSKTSLVELIYALYAIGYLNHGTADLNTIASSFEDYFNIKLDNIYKTYSEIKARKDNRTKFLSELQDHLENKMLQEDR